VVAGSTATATAGMGGAGIAKGTATMMAWAQAKVAALWVTAAVLTIGGAGAVAVHQMKLGAAAPVGAGLRRPAVPVVALAADAKDAPLPPRRAAGGDNRGHQATRRDTRDRAEAFLVRPDDPAIEAQIRLVRARMAGGERLPNNAWPKQGASLDVYASSGPPTLRAPTPRPRRVRRRQEPWILVVRHPSGFAQVTADELKKGQRRDLAQALGKSRDAPRRR